MRVEDFPRPKNDNRRGIHWSASVYHPTGAALDFWLAELQALNIKWVKVLDDNGGSSLALCKRLLALDIMPVVRLYRLMPNPGTMGGRGLETVRRLVGEGVRYFETNNEPDLPAEWKGGHLPANWLDQVTEDFIRDADGIIGAGGLPAFPAMGVGSMLNPIEKIAKRGRADLFSNGAWVALHNYTINHPLEYPYDAVNQEGAPVSEEEYNRLGPWAWDGRARELINAWRAADKNPGDTLTEDATGFLAFHLLNQTIIDTLGHAVPIISTEGGPIIGSKDDRRYPRVTPEMHADWVVAVNDFMQGGREIHGVRCPTNYFAVCHWLIANYRMGYLATGWESQAWYTDWWNTDFHLSGEAPAVARVKAMPTIAVDQFNQAIVIGQVLRGDTAEPLPGLAVELFSGRQQLAQALTDAAGAFKFNRLPPGIYDLVIPAWGVVRSGIAAAVEAQPVTIRLLGGQNSVLSGVVKTSAGEGVAGSQVTLLRDGLPHGAATTDDNGAFRFERLVLGSYRLTLPGITVEGIALDGFQAKNLKLVTGAASAYRYVVTSRRLLSPDDTGNRNAFFGVVRDATGAPINGIKLQMGWEGAGQTALPTTTTGADPYRPVGTYEFVHSPGRFDVRVVQGDWPSAVAADLETAHVPGRSGQPISYEIDFQLKATVGPALIDGVVTGAEPGQRIKLLSAKQAQEQGLTPAGEFAFDPVAPGVYQLELVNIGVVASQIVIEPGMLYRLSFPLQSRLAGRVLLAPEGQVAVLHAPPDWGWTRQALLDLDGSFAFENLPRGRYRLEVGDVVIPDLTLTGENRLQLAPIDLARGRRSVIRGRVADGAGRPQADVLLTLRRAQHRVDQAHTGEDGAYCFTGLANGVYALDAGALGEIAGGITLDGLRDHTADVLWPGPAPRSLVFGRLLDAGGRPVTGAEVALHLRGRAIAQTETDASGAYRFTELAGGSYTLVIGRQPTQQIKSIELAEDASNVRDVVLQSDQAKPLGRYLLFGTPDAQTAEVSAALAWAIPHIAEGRLSGGFSLEDARQAAQVIIMGEQLPASAEALLALAGCAVQRVRGEGFHLIAALTRLFAEES